MARTKRKAVKKYMFELTLGGIGGVGVVLFCLLLWMFLFGVWTGQSLLKPTVLTPDSNDAQMEPLVPEGRTAESAIR